MKALTIWQPWASLCALGIKEYETRGWPTRYRGPLAIHAGVRKISRRDVWTPEVALAVARVTQSNGRHLPIGAVLGIVKLVDVIPVEELLEIPGFTERQEHGLGNYEPGRFAWRLEVYKVFDIPIPCRGLQGLWEWTP